MDSNEKTTPLNSASRRKFAWGLGTLSIALLIAAAKKFPFAPVKNIFGGKPGNKPKTVKMLTQDGRLVEIDESLLTANRKKVTNSELQSWIKRK